MTIDEDISGRADRWDEDPDDRTVREVHAEATRSRLSRAIGRRIDLLETATGERSRPLEQLLRAIESERFGLRRRDADAGQLWLFDEHPEADFARAEAICKATGAVVIHSGGASVYQYGRDVITMPSRSRFRNRAGYYITRFILTAHWAEARLGWKGPTAVGKLVAVLASYKLAEAAGIPVADPGRYQEFHAAWLREIRNKAGFLARALHHSGKVAGFILAFEN